MKPFFLIFGFPYTNPSAGVKSLHTLCHKLNELGAEAYMTECETSPELNTPVLNAVDYYRRRNNGPAIVLYPEIIIGDPYGGDVVARWLLALPGIACADVSHSWKPSDLLFHWRDCYKPESVSQRLDFDVVDPVFNRQGEGERSGVLIYSKKARLAGIAVEHAGFDIIAESARRDAAFTSAELASMFRSAKLLICYEISLVAVEALLCGCPVYYQRSAFMPMPPFDWTPYGVATSLTDAAIERARNGIGKAIDHWRIDRLNDSARVQSFADRCYEALTLEFA